ARGRLATEHAGDIGLVLAELDLVGPIEMEGVDAERLVGEHDMVVDALERGLGAVSGPAPGVAEPQLGQDMDFGVLGSAIVQRESQQDVLGVGLGILDLDVEVAIVVEDAGINQLELGLAPVAPGVLLDQLVVGKRPMRILVEHAGVAVGRHRIEIVVELLDVLAVVALAVVQPEQALLQDRVLAVPQRNREADMLLDVAEAGDAVLAPAIGAAARMVMGKVAPGVSVGAVVLAHRAPLPLAEVWAPFAPRLPAGLGLGQALLFGSHGLGCATTGDDAASRRMMDSAISSGGRPTSTVSGSSSGPGSSSVSIWLCSRLLGMKWPA